MSGARAFGETALARLVADIADGIVVVDREGFVLFANPAAERMLDPSGASLVGTEFGIPALGEMVELDLPETGALVEMRVSPVRWEDRDVLLASLRDISARRRDERDRARLAALVEATDDAVVGLDARGVIETWNAGAATLYGYAVGEAVGRPLDAVVPSADPMARQAGLSRVLAGGGVRRVETREQRRDGTFIDVSITDSPIRDDHGRIVGVARIARDIAERRRLERELRFFADHDPLTSLFNRRRFADELAREVAQIARHGEPGALLVADVDNFKLVNDALGHQGGDELIKAVARVLRSRLRDTDVLARLGGDEFAVILPRTPLADAELVAESLRAAVHEHETVIEARPVRVTLSVGIGELAGDRVAVDDALAVADLAMYRAKQRGRDLVVTARPGHEREHAEEVLAWSARLRAALDDDRFELFAQPIIDIGGGAVERAELLLRMRERDGTLVPPGAFIHTAERYGLIGEIDRWVIRRALRLLREDPGGSRVYAVNVSGASVGDRTLLNFVQDAVRHAGVDPARLIFELTETAAVADLDAALRFAEGVRAIGCAAALDDFGSGFGSFSYLRYLPIDYLKIDGAFVRHLPGSTNDRLLVKAIIDVAHGLGKHTIAEHVGSSEALALLRELGADHAQGFALGEPAPVG